MCELVYLVAPDGADVTILETVARAHGLHCSPCDDRQLDRVLQHERSYATFKQCSCGTALGWRPAETGAPWTERDVRDLVRRGWGEAKIQRWKTQREAARSPAPVDDRPSAEASTMAACLAAMLDAGVAVVGFVVHQAGARVERAPIRTRAQVTAAVVHHVPFDTVQLFGR